MQPTSAWRPDEARLSWEYESTRKSSAAIRQTLPDSRIQPFTMELCRLWSSVDRLASYRRLFSWGAPRTVRRKNGCGRARE